MLQRFRETLTILLLTVLPFHAFLVTVGTKWIAGPNHAPLTYLALWKEALLGLILLIALCELLRAFKDFRITLKPDIIDTLILLLVALSVIVTVSTHGDFTLYLFGFKYDFVPLLSFVLLRRVSWSDNFVEKCFSFLLVVGGIVSVIGIVSFFLPHRIFTMLGYADLHSLYVPTGPLAPYQQLGGLMLRRVQSVMSGPNQLGLWLLLPWAIACARVLRSQSRERAQYACSIFIIGGALVLTFSRSAWIGAAVILVGSFVVYLPKAQWQKILVRLSGLVAAIVLLGLLVFPDILVRTASSLDHITRPLQAMHAMIDHPFGQGMGTAGPASNRVSDTCVYLEGGSDVSWAEVHPDLCVFVNDIQVQPAAACTCPFLPENWYLQIGVELGVIGFILFVLLIALLIARLSFADRKGAKAVFLSVLALSIAALFLHAWEDSAVAYCVWILAAVMLVRTRNGVLPSTNA